MDFDHGGIGRHVAQSLAFGGCFDQQDADDTKAKKRIHHLQHGAQHDIAPFGVFAVEPYHPDAQAHFADGLTAVHDFNEDIVEKVQQENHRHPEHGPAVIPQRPENKPGQLEEQDISEYHDEQIEQPRQYPLAHRRQFVFDRHVLRGGYFDGLLHFFVDLTGC